MAELYPRKDPIWLVETSGRSKLTPGELCAVESAARHNPSATVYLMLTSPRLNPVDSELLASLPNVQPRYLDLDSLFHGSPLEAVWTSGRIHASSWPVSHLSDCVRFLLLHDYGGTYLDTDVISLKRGPDFASFVGREYLGTKSIAAGVIKFTKNHSAIRRLVVRLSADFDGSSWGINGPGVLTQVMWELCNSQGSDQAWPSSCQDVQILPPAAFYAVNWRQADWFFLNSSHAQVRSALTDSYVAHTWGKFTRHREILADSPLAHIMEKHCPLAFGLLGL